MMHTSPMGYAKTLGYISDPSTIRRRVLDWFDRAPSVEKCAAIRAKYVAEREAGRDVDLAVLGTLDWACGHETIDENIYVTEAGNQTCKICRRAMEYRARQRINERKARQATRQAVVEKARAKRRTAKELKLLSRGEYIEAVTEVVTIAAAVFGTTPHDIISYSRAAAEIQARDAACLVARERGCSYLKIGHVLLRDHTTVILATNRATDRAERNPVYFAQIDQIRKAMAW